MFWPNLPTDFHSAAAWITMNRSSMLQEQCIIELIFQSSIYIIWKERNMIIFTSQVTPVHSVRAAVECQIRHRLLSFNPTLSLQPSLPQFFLACTRPP
ncbi:hypothetical protein N665_0084s0006 [Sinapis alba]|nr:hypothetical protein N665_0084s0006 [Sinapis alba]